MGFYSIKMAWNVNQIYQFLLTLIKKNQSGAVSATEFFYHWNAEQYAYHDDLIGKWQNRNNTKEGINAGLIQNEVIMTKLAPFTIPTTLTISSGNSNKPSDFIYTLALRINNKKVFKVNHDQKWAVLDDVIDPPSTTDDSYYYLEYEDYYSFLPSSVTSAELDYVASCSDVVWGYTLDMNHRQVYDSATSAQPKWNQNTIVEITKRTLKQLGVSFKDQDFAAYGNSIIQTGD
jgi:hypothetical protein